MSKLFKEEANLDHFRVHLTSDKPQAKRIFVQLIKGTTEFVRSDKIPSAGDFLFGRFKVGLEKTNKGTKLINPRITIIKDDFGKSDRVSIEPVKHHEAVEMYELARGSTFPADSESDDRGSFRSEQAHQIALLEEFNFAFQQGVAEKHLAFILSRARNFIDPKEGRAFVRENRGAYNRAKKKSSKRK